MRKVEADTMVGPMASPSSPSVRFTAWLVASTTKIMNGR
jgi:hypothetical protein